MLWGRGSSGGALSEQSEWKHPKQKPPAGGIHFLFLIHWIKNFAKQTGIALSTLCERSERKHIKQKLPAGSIHFLFLIHWIKNFAKQTGLKWCPEEDSNLHGHKATAT